MCSNARAQQRHKRRGVGAKPNDFVNNDVRSKCMSRAKRSVLEIRNAASGGVGGDRMFNAQDLEKLPKMTIKMMAFIYSQGIVNMFNDDASPHPDRVRVFNGIKAIIYRVADVEMFHYDALAMSEPDSAARR